MFEGVPPARVRLFLIPNIPRGCHSKLKIMNELLGILKTQAILNKRSSIYN